VEIGHLQPSDAAAGRRIAERLIVIGQRVRIIAVRVVDQAQQHHRDVRHLLAAVLHGQSEVVHPHRLADVGRNLAQAPVRPGEPLLPRAGDPHQGQRAARTGCQGGEAQQRDARADAGIIVLPVDDQGGLGRGPVLPRGGFIRKGPVGALQGDLFPGVAHLPAQRLVDVVAEIHLAGPALHEIRHRDDHAGRRPQAVIEGPAAPGQSDEQRCRAEDQRPLPPVEPWPRPERGEQREQAATDEQRRDHEGQVRQHGCQWRQQRGQARLGQARHRDQKLEHGQQDADHAQDTGDERAPVLRGPAAGRRASYQRADHFRGRHQGRQPRRLAVFLHLAAFRTGWRRIRRRGDRRRPAVRGRRERARQVATGAVARGRVLGQRLHQYGTEGLGQVRLDDAGRGRRLGHLLQHHLGRRSPGERWLAADHLVREDAQDIVVAGRAERLARGLLGRNVGGQAGPGWIREREGAQKLGDAEIGQHRLAARGEEDVRRRQRAVDEALRMRGIQRIGERLQDARDLGQGEAFALAGDFCQSLGQRAPGEIFHDHVGQAARDLEPVHLDDVGMSQARAAPRQLAKAFLECRGVRAGRRVEDLDRDLALELRVARLVHLDRTAAAQGACDRVAAENLGIHMSIRLARQWLTACPCASGPARSGPCRRQ